MQDLQANDSFDLSSGEEGEMDAEPDTPEKGQPMDQEREFLADILVEFARATRSEYAAFKDDTLTEFLDTYADTEDNVFSGVLG